MFLSTPFKGKGNGERGGTILFKGGGTFGGRGPQFFSTPSRDTPSPSSMYVHV